MNREVNVTCETAVEPAIPTKEAHIAQDEFLFCGRTAGKMRAAHFRITATPALKLRMSKGDIAYCGTRGISISMPFAA